MAMKLSQPSLTCRTERVLEFSFAGVRVYIECEVVRNDDWLFSMTIVQ